MNKIFLIFGCENVSEKEKHGGIRAVRVNGCGAF